MVASEGRVIYQAACLAALAAFAAVLVMGFGAQLPEPGLSVQPSQPGRLPFEHSINAYPEVTLRFFAADSLFVLSYALVFVGVHTVVASRARLLAGFGLGAGWLAAVLDAAENAHFITYALMAENDVPLTAPALPLIYLIANLKWMAAFAALYAFGLGWPRTVWLDWVIVALMLAFPLVGVVSVAAPALVPVRGLFFLVAMPLFAWVFWRRSRAV